jgi:hypothetical protein
MTSLVLRLVGLCAATAILAACDSRRSNARPSQSTSDGAAPRAKEIATPRPELSDSLKAEIRSACNDLAKRVRSLGAAKVVVNDTVLIANEYQASSGSCIVHAGEFGTKGVDPDLFKSGLSARNWKWHPFEGSAGDVTYGIVRRTVQCEVTPLGVDSTYFASSELSSSRARLRSAMHRASGFHIFCSDL